MTWMDVAVAILTGIATYWVVRFLLELTRPTVIVRVADPADTLRWQVLREARDITRDAAGE